MRAHSLALLGLLLPLAAAAPHDHRDAPASRPSRTPPSWRRLSDAIIRRIWSLPRPESAEHNGRILPAATEPFVARYGEDVVLRFTISSAADAHALADAADVLFLDVWEFNEDWADIRVAKDVVPSLLGLLPHSLRHAHQPLMQDLDLAQAVFDSYPTTSATQSHQDDAFAPSLRAPRSKGHPFLQDYQPLSVIDPWMKLMASMFTTHVRRITVGTTSEGRDIPALRVGVHPTNNDAPAPRKTVLITAGSHAREWISTSTVNYVAWNLINAYGKDREITRLLEEFDFVLVPTLNPDGYVYSWESDRLWRKNRQETPLRFCNGIDLDRSYGFQWDGDALRTNPCSESYAGSAPFAAAESASFAAWARNESALNTHFVGFLDLHSYSQQILYPYSYSCADDPPALEDLEELAMGLAKAIRISRKGHAYKVASACEGNVLLSGKRDRKVLPRIEASGGSALDWFHHELKVKYAFQVKLRDTGSYGFLLPKENIAPTGEEMLDAVLYFGRFMLGEVGVAEAKTDGKDVKTDTKDAKEVKDVQIEDDWVLVDNAPKTAVEDEVLEL
ncbi:putative metallocarboxypeptidase ECM14 [Boeremia exigua]|uniref:putative metallocarboxypeptidase ECM14 n=1 Tax=Boeremia exigua TaxID=749465 RepID=UPI001E8DA921|nr:putative metallocarboxypeptidase ECM14 [Boeremia exigua]KAH6625732.1 putative metallocarboxypeptidase ECM14 [Boeremia exigua]